MKVTKEFRVLTVGNIEPTDPYQLPIIGWKVSLDGTQLGQAWLRTKDKAGDEAKAESLCIVLESAAKTIKYYDRHGKLPGWRWRGFKAWIRGLC